MRTYTIVAGVLLCAGAVQLVAAQEAEWPSPRRSRRDGVHIRIARNYHVSADQVVTWPVVVIGGSATIDGRVEDDFVVIGGPVRVGPTAQIRANLTSVGGEVTVADGAEITGEIHDVSVLWPEMQFVLRDWLWDIDRGWFALFSLMGNMFRLTLIMLATCFLALIAPGWIRRIESGAESAPVASGLVGLTLQVLFLPLVVLSVIGLIVTIIGIPLLLLVPFAILAFVVTWLGGFAGVAAQIGGRLRRRVTGGRTDVPVLDVAFGVALLGLLTMIGNLLAVGPYFFGPAAAAFTLAGVVVEYLAWTVGLGAGLLTPFRNHWRTVPPPVPAPASATA